jgi:hypothetical protein
MKDYKVAHVFDAERILYAINSEKSLNDKEPSKCMAE